MDMVDKVRQALLASGHEDSIAEFPAGTHSAADAAAAVGCSVAQIAKSIVFRAGDNVILVVASGAHRIDRNKVSSAIGEPVKSADSAWVQSKTGFAVGGVAPVGHDCQITTIIDSELLSHHPLWAAAGSPMHAFRTTAEQLIRLTHGMVAEVRQA
jgi:prolyl-tRNA editing enzyme YbaK/EbsC (Cys-tRNA(Pro) deacylase)